MTLIFTRQANESDIPALVGLEERIYRPLGTVFYGAEYFEAWLEIFPEGLTVADDGEKLVGYQVSQIVTADPNDISNLKPYEEATDHGFIRNTHNMRGDTLHCFNLCSEVRGAGMKLSLEVIVLAHRLKMQHILTYARLPGFASYLSQLGEMVGPGGVTEHEAAMAYASATAKSVSATDHTEMDDFILILGEPEKPDPVLRKQLSFVGSSLAGVMENCMDDPESMNYSAIIFGDVQKAAMALGLK